jgi:pyruvate dehydrogenase complex dehydrogenase (E1) component
MDRSGHVVIDPWPGDVAVYVYHSMREMLEAQRDVFYCVMAMNENVAQPSLPAAARAGVIRGLYRFRAAALESKQGVQLLGPARFSAKYSRPPTSWPPHTAWRPTCGA